jgi:hypothetical protein
MLRNRAIPLSATSALIICTLAVLIGAAATTSRSASATGRPAFCNPHRTRQSFGGRPANGFGAHLAVAPGPVRPGATATFRIVNEGSDELAEGDEIVQRWTGSSWIRMPEAGGPKLLALAFVRARSVSGCSGPLTGKHWKSGKYRFLLRVEAIEKSREPTQPEKHWLRASFLLRRGPR